jgi:hypothetical protein
VAQGVASEFKPQYCKKKKKKRRRKKKEGKKKSMKIWSPTCKGFKRRNVHCIRVLISKSKLKKRKRPPP